MRTSLIVIALLLTSCGGPDSDVSRITGKWRSSGMRPGYNVVDLTLSPDGNTVEGLGDVNNVIYDLEGSWQGSLGATEILKLDMTVTVTNLTLNGTGTLSTGADEEDLTLTGNRRGLSFQLSLNPEVGEALQLSGNLNYNYNSFRLEAELEDIPPVTQGGAPRDLQLTVSGKARGGPLDLF